MKLSILFLVHNPNMKAHPQDEIRAFLDAERPKFWERHDSLALWARELPKSNHRRHEFQETALIDPSKNARKIRKVFIFFKNFTP